MKEWEAAHLRMLETLPKRTHKALEPIEVAIVRSRSGGPKTKQPVVINGVKHPSLTAAASALGTHRCEIWQMVKRGEAEFA